MRGIHRASGVVSMYYKSAMTRQMSEKNSEGSPRGSDNGEDKRFFYDADAVEEDKELIKAGPDESLNKGNTEVSSAA